MRGNDEQQLDVLSYVSPEQRVPQDHPLRSLRAMTDEALRDLQPRFNRLYAKTGRPSIALLRKVRHRGIFKVGWVFTFAAAAYNLIRMRNLASQAT
jgi:hypothetical protein